LDAYGITVEDAMVMDVRNEPFPVPVTRDLGGFVVQEIQQMDYPFFVDIRQDGMDAESSAVANLPAVTMNWASPITLHSEKNTNRKIVTLLKSSPESWLHASADIQPDFQKYPKHGFAKGDALESKKLAVAVQGSFASYFSDKPDPRSFVKEEDLKKDNAKKTDKAAATSPVIKKSPISSRLVVVGSSEFINDSVISLSRAMGQERSLNSLEFLQNLVDWSVEDESLLAIRSRGSHARILKSMSRGQQAFWEWFNYIVAVLALTAVSLYAVYRRKREIPMKLDASVI
jgi:ABC-2 type transport system permease protein